MADNGRAIFFGTRGTPQVPQEVHLQMLIFQLMFGVPKCNPDKPESKQCQSRQSESTGFTTAKSFTKPLALQKIHKNVAVEMV